MSINPYAYALEGRNPQAVMAETPAQLANLLGAMSPERIEAKPAPDKWNVREIVAHLADCEVAFAFRLRQALAGVDIQPFDQDAWAKVYRVYSLEEALATFTALRAWNVSFLSALSEADRKLPVTHPERGTMALWTIVETIGGHDRHHLAQIETR